MSDHPVTKLISQCEVHSTKGAIANNFCKNACTIKGYHADGNSFTDVGKMTPDYGSIQNKLSTSVETVSYTHLTLPTT